MAEFWLVGLDFGSLYINFLFFFYRILKRYIIIDLSKIFFSSLNQGNRKKKSSSIQLSSRGYICNLTEQPEEVEIYWNNLDRNGYLVWWRCKWDRHVNRVRSKGVGTRRQRARWIKFYLLFFSFFHPKNSAARWERDVGGIARVPQPLSPVRPWRDWFFFLHEKS